MQLKANIPAEKLQVKFIVTVFSVVDESSIYLEWTSFFEAEANYLMLTQEQVSE